MNELIAINEIKVFPEPDGLTKILNSIENRVKGLVFDMSDPKSRATCKSTAFEITKDKTFLVGLGKTCIADKEEAVKRAKAEIRRAETYLTELAKKVREPLTLWEEAEEKRRKEEKEYADDWDAAIIENAQFDIRKKQEADEARLNEERAAFEAEKAEAARKQKEEDDRIAKEKAELAAEKARLEKEEADRKASEQKRLANENHRKEIISNITAAMSEIYSEHDSAETRINEIIVAIISGKIPHVIINF